MRPEFDLASVEQGVLGTRFEGRVRHFASVDSTNQLALIAAQAGAKWGVWVADEQTAGRGRGGHTWHSAPGDGLYVSALVTPSVAMESARDLPMAAGLAAKMAVRESTGLELDLRWPNDLMFGDRKCGGILVESAAKESMLRYAVIGIGINVNHHGFPPGLARIATSLYLESGRKFEREPLLASLLRLLEEEVTQLGDSSKLYRRFSTASTWASGKHVRVGEGSDSYTGWTRGLNGQGFLLVEDDAGAIRTVLSGGVRSA
jgi:BirA family biotin operon repressor/biotin-[acetyl-CoA-carboxylase] ligase